MDRSRWSEQFPELMKEWCSEDNPIGFSCGKKARWKCSIGHVWYARPYSRFAEGNGCPYCAGRLPSEENNLASALPVLASQWDATKNPLTPKDVTPHSNKMIWWKCLLGHNWKATVNDRANGSGCPYCSGNRARPDNCLAQNQKLVSELHPTKNGTFDPSTITPKSGKRIWWRCCKGHEWKAQIGSRTNGHGCPLCRQQTSKIEIRLFCEISKLFGLPTEWKAKVQNTEFDILLPESKIAIEFDGWYWHHCQEDRDFKKSCAAQRLGLKLIRVRETPLELTSCADIQVEQEEDHFSVCQKVVLSLSILTGVHQEGYNDLVATSEYEAVVASLSFPRNNIVNKAPHVAEEWNHSKNGALLPENFSHKSAERVWWRCVEGHEWKAQIHSRVNGNGCPYCSKRHYKNRNEEGLFCFEKH